jgi:DNA replication and repair protein RecF
MTNENPAQSGTPFSGNRLMSLIRLQITHFRNIRSADLSLCGEVNLFVGPNASGKTSLLEAIDCLSRGRSFRARLPTQLTTHGESSLTLFGQVDSGSGRISALGMELGRARRMLRRDGRTVDTVESYAAALPVQTMHPLSHVIINGPPGHRRAFMDWGVFHVKQGDIRSWREYTRVLRQRNLLLSRGGGDREIEAWDEALTNSAERLDQARAGYVSQIEPLCAQLAEEFLDGAQVGLRYRRGWSEGTDLASTLRETLDRDRQLGHTGNGPHRADLQITLSGRSARDFASRGQQKLLVVVLLLAQLRAFTASGSIRPTLLVDDLAAELDPARRERVIERLAELPAQVILTALERNALDLSRWCETRVFHVKHGGFEELV